MMGSAMNRFLWRAMPLVQAAVLCFASASYAQRLNPNEREAKAQINVEDKDDIRKAGSKIWVLDFKFYDPRLITVDIPGEGRKLCWYLRYQVVNNTKEPRTFIPIFELVTVDKPAVYKDKISPKVQEAIRQIEDPTGYLDIKNSVTISSKPIVPSKPEIPKPMHGVAIWYDVNPDANRFSIFVTGLSNGWSLADDPADAKKPIVRRKTLQLNFRRVGDRYEQKSSEIRFVAPIEWVYRATTASGSGRKAQPEKKASARKPEAALLQSTQLTPER